MTFGGLRGPDDDPIPIGEPDEDEGYGDDEEDDEDEDDGGDEEDAAGVPRAARRFNSAIDAWNAHCASATIAMMQTE